MSGGEVYGDNQPKNSSDIRAYARLREGHVNLGGVGGDKHFGIHDRGKTNERFQQYIRQPER